MSTKIMHEMTQKHTNEQNIPAVEKTKEVLIEQREHINRQLAHLKSHDIALDVNTLGTRLADTANALSVMQAELNRAWLRMQQMHEDIQNIKHKLA